MLDKIVLKGKEMQMLTDEEFFALCQANPEINIERNSKREIIIMSPTGSKSGVVVIKIAYQLENWNIKTGKGFVFDSSAGFTLPDESIKSPDAAWISSEKWNALSEEEKERFAPACPEFIVELKSKSDRLTDLQEKMREWITNGVQLGWLIDPDEETVYIYRPQCDLQAEKGFYKKLPADPVLPGFKLDLKKLKV